MTPVADERMTPAAIAQLEPIHHSTVFGYDTPTTCGRTEQPLPATNEWRYVDCPACLDAATPAQRAEREDQTRRYPAGGGGS